MAYKLTMDYPPDANPEGIADALEHAANQVRQISSVPAAHDMTLKRGDFYMEHGTEHVPLDPEPPCIRRTFFGGSEEISYGEFARLIIMDEDIALDIARNLAAGEDPYQYNTQDLIREPTVYEEFTVTDLQELNAAINAEDERLGNV